MNDVLVVVVAQTPGQLLVVHLRLVLTDPPPSGDLHTKDTVNKELHFNF